MRSSTPSTAPRSVPTSRSSKATPRPRRSAADVLRPVGMVPDAALVDRFRAGLDALIAADARIGVAVSGGPDSLALLLLASAARPDRVEVATVDHSLRPESRAEAETVASIC